MDYKEVLKSLKPAHNFFIGIDSDGCVFDTMDVKQKEFFIPNALKYFDLFGISRILRETWEFVNLNSIHRGGNRFTSIIKVFELLQERDEIKQSGYILPAVEPLKEWIKTESKLSNANLRSYFDTYYNSDLELFVNWTEAVNEDISRWLRNIPPFPAAKTAIEKLYTKADIVVVSQTPLEALEREWEEHGIIKYAAAIAGQEHGTKSEHLAFSAAGKYPDNHILMIGDAKGDLDAAINNGILFYPIIPGKENDSWEKFQTEALERFLSGSYSGTYEENLLAEFRNSLRTSPPWVR
jgi:phosphoglycolate phosphatase-like HAD superfamily hydrolase